MPFSHWLELSIVSGLAFAGLFAIVSTFGYRKFRILLVRLPCRMRARMIAAWGIFPPLVGFLLPLFSLIPTWMERHGLSAGHCRSHDNGITHLCWFEPLSDTLLIPVGLGLFTAVFGWGLIRIFITLLKHLRLQRRLRAISTLHLNRGFCCLATEHPVAFCAGLLRPRVYLSQGLLRELSGKQRAIVLAHEQTHCRRRDILRRTLLKGFLLFHGPKARRALLEDLDLAMEQICDEAAAATAGDRLSVAETIVTLERRMRSSSLPQMAGAMAFHGGHTEARVRALLDAPGSASPSARVGAVLVYVLIVLGCLALSMPWHHWLILF